MAQFTLKTRQPATVAERHQLKIARDSMKIACAMLGVAGGPNHYEAASIIHRITGVIVAIDAPCSCRQS